MSDNLEAAEQRPFSELSLNPGVIRRMMNSTEAVMRLFSVLGLVLMLGGCGTLVGAGAGGYAGNQFGKGSGKTAATAAGVVGGGLLGHAVTGD